MSFRSTLSPIDLESIGKSWVQSNRGRFLFAGLPKCLALGFAEGRTTTTYKLPKLDNTLAKGVGMVDWQPGDAPTTERELGSIDATFTPRYKRTQRINRPTKRNARHVLNDLENNIVPIQMGLAYQQIEAEVVALLANASVYGTAKTFGGTGALDTFASDQTPDYDINENLMPMVKWRGLGLSLECVMSTHVMTVLARHPVYSGAGTGSAIAATLPRDEFERRFRAAHPQVDALHIVDTVIDTARAGQTSAPRINGNTLLWFGLLDRRGSYDLREDGSQDAPDGALMIAMSREPEVAVWETPGSEVESFAGQAEYAIYFPRASDASASDFAHFYGASEIFTTNPT